MLPPDHSSILSSAINDFRRARSRANLKEIVARFTGESIDLLSYEEVRKQLHALGSSDRGLQDIPLDAIVGSVGRYTDFTRDFLPREGTDVFRWARIKMAASGLVGLPPIEVYKVGEAYFVKDGNHRVSVARQIGAKSIQAYVNEVVTRVPLSADDQPDDIILKAEYVKFLEKTRLDVLRPTADLSVTVPGQYPMLIEHINVHRYFMGLNQKREIPYDEAVTDWYDTVYLPVIRSIQELGILHYFADRTETDLYLWISEHRASLQQELGWDIKPEVAVQDLIHQVRTEPEPIVTRIVDILSQGKLESGPPPGQWRKEARAIHRQDQLFMDILVPVSGAENGWWALEQALAVAQLEDAHLLGLHVVANEALKESEIARAVQIEFNRRCAERGVPGSLAITSGEIARQIATQARLTDLVITSLVYPPPPNPIARFDSGFRDLIQRCPRPVLAVPQVASPLTHALLAYDGSPKAEEALFVATHIADRWKINLTVLTVIENGHVLPETLIHARHYLEERHVQAAYVIEQGSPAEIALQVAMERGIDLLIMGGYGFNPVWEVVLGSVVDQVLRLSDMPALICR